MLKKTVVLTVIFGFIFYSSLSFAEEKNGIFKKLIDFKNKAFVKKDTVAAAKAETKKPAAIVPAPAAAPKTAFPAKIYTREEMIADVKEILDDEEEILNFVPGLKKSVAEKDKSLYTYEGLKLEDLDKEKLKKMFTRVRQEAARLRANRLNEQIENIRRNQQLTATAGGGAPKVPVTPPSPPRIYSAPSVPRVPTPVPQPPRPPAPPVTPRR
ncbi:MAG: hypothetical protein WC738_00810 [Candidatus Omnitrophota bacterium]